MSGTLSAAVRFEEHFGPVVPEVTTSPGPSRSMAPHVAAHAGRMRDLVEQMRRCVIGATQESDVAAKVELWASYRTARAEALAMLTPATDASEFGPLRSI
ncbi:MAG TPA: hypothetical protein VII76_01800 [Acidimicrobiales bacterium]